MTPLPHHPSVAPPTAVQLAAKWIAIELGHTMIAPFGDQPWSPNSMRLAEALAAAGLLCTPAERRMLDDVNQQIADSAPTDAEVQAIFDLAAAKDAVVDAACAESVAEQNSVRATTAALDAPNRSPALTAAGDAARAVHAARAARRDTVRRLLQHRQGHE